MRNKFKIALIALLLVAPKAHAEMFNPTSFTLKNGLQVVIVSNHRAPVVTHMLWLKAGGMEDPWGKSGIAHFQEHLMFKGTKTHAEGDYSRMISERGGTQNAFTSQDFTAYYVTIGKKYLPMVMDLEADRLANWQITEAQVDAEKKVIVKERQQRTEDDPIQGFWEEVNSQLFFNHPYQRPVIGWQAEILDLDKKSLEDFHKAYYAPNNLVLVISGDVTAKEIKPLIEKYYGGLKSFPTQKNVKPARMVLNTERRMEKTSPMVRETMWSMHYVTDPADLKNLTSSDSQNVLAKILGDGRIGRLYRRLVVEMKIATSASVSFDPIARGPVRFGIIVVPAPGVELPKIEKIVREEIQNIIDKGITDKEVSDATQSMEIDSIYARDGVSTPANIIGAALTSGMDLQAIENWPQRIKQVTAEGVKQAAIGLFTNQKPMIAILKPEGQKK